MLMTAQGAELVPNIHASVSYRSISLLKVVGGLNVITSLCIQQTAESQKNNAPRIQELMHENGSGKCMGCVKDYRWCMSQHMYYGCACINHRASSLQSGHSNIIKHTLQNILFKNKKLR